MDVDGRTGAYLADTQAEVVQALRDRLLTPVGGRPFRPDYGSPLGEYGDANYRPAPIREAVAVAAAAEARRYALTDVTVSPLANGDISVQVYGEEVVSV